MKKIVFIIFLLFLCINLKTHSPEFEDDKAKINEKKVLIFQKSNDSTFPLAKLNINIGYLTDGKGHFNSFKDMAEKYVKTENKEIKPQDFHIIFWLFERELLKFEPFENRLASIKRRYSNAKIVLVAAGDFPIDEMPNNLDAIIYSPSNTSQAWTSMAEAAFSGIEVDSNFENILIPNSMKKLICEFPKTRLKYGIPEEAGMCSDTLELIDKIVLNAIKKEATPGARVLVARNGIIILDKCYGSHTYDKKRQVQKDDVYDLASVTKILATMPVLMQLYDIGKWRLGDKIVNFIPETDTTDLKDLTIKQLLLHESGLPSFIPFYTYAIDNEKLEGILFSTRKTNTHTLKLGDKLYMNKTVKYRDDIFSKEQDLLFSISVAKDFYMNFNYLDSMFYKLLKSNVKEDKKYLYSDINFLLLQQISENLCKEPLDIILDNQFYNLLGANSLCFNPLNNIPITQIIPTEDDIFFRNQLVHGYVHDQTAAMLGGVAGHAGLFGSAGDLAKILQMLLNKGTYGGHRYLSEETVDFFTSTQSKITKRGLGFDKYDPDKSAFSKLCSPLAYGHTGFTGTIVWVDPQYDIIYIFLSNRVHPYSYNNSLIEMGVRSKILDVVYRAVISN